MKEARDILREALSERSARNPSYSLRAFARDLGVSPQQLSNVINGRRGMGSELAERVAESLDLDAREKTQFTESLRARFSRSRSERAVALARIQGLQSQGRVKSLELDLFKAVSGWHHFALIELVKLSLHKKKRGTAWFAQKLGISEAETDRALGRLERLELISKTKTGWIANQDIVVADRGVPTESIRNFHRQLLEAASQALVFQTQEERYGSSSTLPVRVRSLERARKLIQEFRLKFDQEISDPEGGEEVYGLSLQFFRLTRPTTRKEEGKL